MNEDVKTIEQEDNTLNTQNPTKEEIENAIDSLSLMEIDKLLDEFIEEMK